jgi:hypothetical protein
MSTGEMPNDPIGTVFEDRSATSANGILMYSGYGYTWQWDNIQIS